MALDDLKKTIETLWERIQAHRPYLEGYETRTRQVLIDPMLRTSWDGMLETPIPSNSNTGSSESGLTTR